MVTMDFFSSPIVSLRSLFYSVRQVVRGEKMDLDSLLSGKSGMGNELSLFGASKRLNLNNPSENDIEEIKNILKERGFVLPYRKDIVPCLEGGHGSDQGWGCMLRAMQMMLAQGLYRTNRGKFSSNDKEAVRILLNMFSDNPNSADSTDSPLGIRQFCSLYASKFKKPVGSWFGPTSAAKVAVELLNKERKLAKAGKSTTDQKGILGLPRLQIFDDGAIFEDELCGGSDWPCIALVCRTVGKNQIQSDKTFQKGVVSLLRDESCVGVACGDSGVSAHYFVGVVGTGASDTSSEDPASLPLLHWDPHMSVLPGLQAVQENDVTSNSEEPLRNPETRYELVKSCLGQLRVDRINESFCVGIMVNNKDEWTKAGGVKERLLDKGKIKSGMGEVLEVLPQNPIKMLGGDVECEDFDEDF